MAILIAYMTSKGSTREIAERIASRLEEAFPTTPVECRSIKDVTSASLPKYSTVIVGSAVHMGSWLRPARRFLHENTATLNAMPQLWAFSVGMPARDVDHVNEEAKLEAEIRKVVPGLRGHKLFQGRFYKQDLGWFLGMIFTCCVPSQMVRWGDARNWDEIEAWADKVGKESRDNSNGGERVG